VYGHRKAIPRWNLFGLSVKWMCRNAKNLTTKLTLYENLLTELLPILDPARQQTIKTTLAEVG
jgi:hypothetical protein